MRGCSLLQWAVQDLRGINKRVEEIDKEVKRDPNKNDVKENKGRREI